MAKESKDSMAELDKIIRNAPIVIDEDPVEHARLVHDIRKERGRLRPTATMPLKKQESRSHLKRVK